LKVISEYISRFDNFNLIKSFNNPITAIEFLNQYESVDLVFLDVEMPQLSGLEVARIIKHKTEKLIFTTSHIKYAIDALDLKIDNLLLKPYSFSRFSKVLSDLTDEIIVKETFFFIKNKTENCKLTKLHYQEIIAIESVQNYVNIYTTKKDILAHIPLSKIKDFLKDKGDFTQIHRCFIISKKYIEEIDGNIIKMHNGLLVNIGDSYKNNLNDYFTKYTLKTGSRI